MRSPPPLAGVLAALVLSACSGTVPEREDGSHAEEGRYPDGSPKSRSEIVTTESGETVRHGRCEEWHENGQKKRESDYENGVQHGSETTWYPNGQVSAIKQYARGNPHGVWKMWYRDGTRAVEIGYRDGGQHGRYVTWRENGVKEQEATFLDDEATGVWTYWAADGSKRLEWVFEDGKKVDTRIFRDGKALTDEEIKAEYHEALRRDKARRARESGTGGEADMRPGLPGQHPVPARRPTHPNDHPTTPAP